MSGRVSRFDVFVRYMIDRIEGRHSKHGPTMWGINAEANPDLRQLIASERLTKADAIERYRWKYWPQVPRGDYMALPISFFVFDRVVQGSPRPFVDRVVTLKLLAMGVEPGDVAAAKKRHVTVDSRGVVKLTDRTGDFLTSYPDVAMAALIKWLRSEKAARFLKSFVTKEPASVRSMSNRLYKVAVAMETLWGRKT